MQLVSDFIEALPHIGGVLLTVGGAVAALWKFWAWRQDRRDQLRLDSATFFAKSEAAPWHKAFGEQWLTRLHFKRLTAIDRRADHAALFRLHERLGQTDEDWSSLRKTGLIRTSSPVPTIRKLRRRDYWQGLFCAVCLLVCALGGVTLTVIAINLAGRTTWPAVRFGELLNIVIIAAYAAVLFIGPPPSPWSFAASWSQSCCVGSCCINVTQLVDLPGKRVHPAPVTDNSVATYR